MAITLDPQLYREAADRIEQNGWWAGVLRGYYLPDGTHIEPKADPEKLDFRDPRLEDCDCAYTSLLHIAREREWTDPYGNLGDGYIEHFVKSNDLRKVCWHSDVFMTMTGANDLAPDAATVCGWLRHAADVLEGKS